MTHQLEAGSPPNPASVGRRCNLCGGEDFACLHAWSPEDPWNPASISLAMWQCRACSLVCLNPVPGSDHLPDNGDWYGKKSKAVSKPKRNWKYRHVFHWAMRQVIGQPTDRFVTSIRRAKPKGHLLDVGCGRGEFLNRVQAYYQCTGLEFSGVAAAEARVKGFKVIDGRVEDATLPDKAFDVVVLDSVVEHLADPKAAMANLSRAMRPGGVVALVTPKYGGPTSRLRGREWYGFRLGYHTFLFSSTTLRKLLEESGFEVLRRPKRDRPLDDKLILFGRKTG